MSEDTATPTRRSLRRSLVPSVDATAAKPAPKEAKVAVVKKEQEQEQQEEDKKPPVEPPPPAEAKKSTTKAENNISKCKYKMGSLVDVRDASKVWYKSRIIELDEENRRVKVHYLGWNSRYDQWYDVDSSDMRLSKEDKIKNASTTEKSSSNTAASSSQAKQCDNSLESKMQVGTRAMAKWKDEFYYPCLITRVMYKNDVKYYQIKFYDNVRKMVRLNNLREPTQEELDQFPVIESGKKQQQQPSADESKSTTTEEMTPNVEETGASLPETKLDEEEERRRRAEAELLLAIQQPVLALPAPNVEAAENPVPPAVESTEKPAEKTEKTDLELSSRKSLRVKRLRTYTEEIVFDSPASSITYNLASVHNKSNLTLSTSNAKRLKTSQSAQSEPQPTAEQTQAIKDQNRSKVQGYFKSLKSLNKSLSSPATNVSKKPASKEKKSELVQPSPTPQPPPVQEPPGEEQHLKKKKKLKKDKKRLFEKLIETSKKQLRHQQELIEKQLKKHQHKKSQKKLAKLLKKQKRQQEMEQQQSQLFGQPMYFESNEAILNQLIQQSRLLEMSQQQQQQQQKPVETTAIAAPAAARSASNEPICCTVENCTKTFRKQHLLEYHLKYHHYLNADTTADGLNKTASASSITSAGTAPAAAAPKRRRLSSNGNTTLNKKLSKLTSLSSSLNLTSDVNATNIIRNEHTADDNEADFIGDLIGLNDDAKSDPYEVIHCRCGNHTSTGFMIQCDTCLCWQHGDCVNIKKGETVPKNYSCWVCNEPDNKLKGLKYKNWLNIRLEKEILTKIENLDHSSSSTAMAATTANSNNNNKSSSSEGRSHENENQPQNDEYNKLCLLNECSRKFYNLNTLMYTLEYQISLFNQLVDNLSKKCSAAAAASTSNVNIDAEFDAEEQMATKISLNIEHLQNCLTKKFDQFNSKLDEFERRFPDDAKGSVSTKFNNLKQLYKQFETIVKS